MFDHLPQEITDKYRLSLTPEGRFYEVDLSKRDYDLEGATPVFMLLGKKRLSPGRSWIRLLPLLAEALLEGNPLPEKTLLEHRFGWSRRAIFTEKEASNSRKIRDGLWLNCNTTAVHSLFTVQDLLSLFDFPLDEVKLVIHRVPLCEPEEVKELLKSARKEAFKNLLTTKGKTPEAQKIIEDRIHLLNKRYFKSEVISRSYNDLWLFDSKPLWDNYCAKLKALIAKDPGLVEKAKPGLLRRVGYLTYFYREILFKKD